MSRDSGSVTLGNEASAIREVTVERADTDPGAARDLLQRGRLAARCERVASGREHLLVVAPRVGALGRVISSMGASAVLIEKFPLTNGGSLRTVFTEGPSGYSGGGLRFSPEVKQ